MEGKSGGGEIRAGDCEPAKRVELWFPEQVVAVLAHPVQPGEYRLVVHALALDVEERPFAERVLDARQRPDAGHPVVAAGVVVQVVRGRDRGHGHGHDGHQRGRQHQRGLEAHPSAVFRHLRKTERLHVNTTIVIQLTVVGTC